jgi:5-methylcytosine-specific restriction endonuclease McrBC regulatory subunit McrC
MPRTSTKIRVLHEGDEVPADVDTPGNRVRLWSATRHIADAFRLVKQGRRLRVGNVVGFIDLGRVQLELRPKASGVAGQAGDPRQLLLDLLSLRWLAPRTLLRRGAVQKTRSLLEVLFKAFADDLAERLSLGIPRRYSEREDNSTVLRGRILFGRMATRPPGNDHVLPIRHAPLQFDNPLSRVILATVRRLQGLTRSVHTATTLQHCGALLDRVAPVPLTEQLVNRLHLTALEANWKPVVDFATALAQGQPPDPVAAGTIRSFGLTFSLDDLFESALRKVLPQTLAGSLLSLAPKRQRAHLLRSQQTDKQILPLRPDYLFINNGGEKILVADAKWKLLNWASPALGLLPSDAYQLTAYLAAHKLDRGVLFFPADKETPLTFGAAWTHPFTLLDGSSNRRVTIVAVELAALVSGDAGRRQEAQTRLRQAISSS